MMANSPPKGTCRHCGVDGLFHTIMGADSVEVPKPSGQMVQRFAERTGLAASAIAMVGDNIHDLEEARNGGAGLAMRWLTAAT